MLRAIAYIVIGLVIGLVSKLHPHAEKFVLFFYVGLVIAAYGAMRMLWVCRPGKKPRVKKEYHPRPQHKPRGHHHHHYVQPRHYQNAHHWHPQSNQQQHVHQQQRQQPPHQWQR
jgi:ABC-type nickel/cobalt efflux system permease component RcnA